MNDSIFSKGIKKLEAAFRVNQLSVDSLRIYHNKLSEVEELKFERAVDEIIDNEDFFPSIHKLKKYCKPQGVVL